VGANRRAADALVDDRDDQHPARHARFLVSLTSSASASGDDPGKGLEEASTAVPVEPRPMAARSTMTRRRQQTFKGSDSSLRNPQA
jgi:hypothetical protein